MRHFLFNQQGLAAKGYIIVMLILVGLCASSVPLYYKLRAARAEYDLEQQGQ